MACKLIKIKQHTMHSWLETPKREYAIVALVAAAFLVNLAKPDTGKIFFVIALAGSLPTLWGALKDVFEMKISINVFNVFALGVSFFTNEIRSAAFIVLMLSFASLLDWNIATKSRDAVRELLKLKPTTAFIEADGIQTEVPIESVKSGDILLVPNAGRIPVDGVIIFGRALVNESSVTGESRLIEKIVGDPVISSTLNESGAIKIKATKVGKESTIERMAALIHQAAKNKSRQEKLADKFAQIFLPVVILIGAGTYFFTLNIKMTAAIFLVACADDMAVAIPLAVTAAIGKAAKRGVIIKGGEWLDALSKVKTIIFDKTGTLTYGNLQIKNIALESSVDENKFWLLAAAAEKFSEHPTGKVIFKEAVKKMRIIPPDPDEVQTIAGTGIRAKYQGDEIILGNKNIMPRNFDGEGTSGQTAIFIEINKKYAGMITLDDVPRTEAKTSIDSIKSLGIKNVLMFTGDNEQVASRIAGVLGIDDFKSTMSPENKLKELNELSKQGPVAMVGDGVNDAPALAQSDVGIAMGKGGTAVAIEAADIVILTDNIDRIPETISLGRRASSVIKGDMWIWLVSNALGFALVLTGVAGPALAALYNFLTDFFPLINSAKLLRSGAKNLK